MPDRAHVTSVEALESFRSSLIIYLSKARPTLEEVNASVQRTRGWLEGERRTYWENEFRRRSRALEEAQAAVFSSRLSSLREVSAAEQMAVRRAKRDLDEAEAKLRVVKRGTGCSTTGWTRWSNRWRSCIPCWPMTWSRRLPT